MSKSHYDIALLPGDGIGPEVIQAAQNVLAAAAAECGLRLHCNSYEAGAELYARTGYAISESVMSEIGKADAVLLGAMGLPHIRKPDGTELTPQIDIRERYELFASLRPCKLLAGAPSRLKADAIDVLVIRETTEGLFAGRHLATRDEESSSDTMTITRRGCERLFNLAYAQARTRRERFGTPGRVTLLDKSNVLRSNAFMRAMFDEAAARHADIASERLYIDAGSMMFITQPERFDVVVTENVFGDIVSEIGAGIVGGLGVAPSGDVGADHGVFQPSHGSAPDIAGRDLANPVATMLSAVMMLEWLSEKHGDDRCEAAARHLRAAVERAVATGPRTRDLGGSARTTQVTQAVLDALSTKTLAVAP